MTLKWDMPFNCSLWNINKIYLWYVLTCVLPADGIWNSLSQKLHWTVLVLQWKYLWCSRKQHSDLTEYGQPSMCLSVIIPRWPQGIRFYTVQALKSCFHMWMHMPHKCKFRVVNFVALFTMVWVGSMPIQMTK